MDRDLFHERLVEATERAIGFAREYVFQELEGDVSFAVHPNQSCDEGLVDGEIVFPDEDRPDDEPIKMRDTEEVVRFLWRNGCVPEWIDVNVAGTTDTETRVHLLCCGRFTDRDDLLYHAIVGIPPFAIKSPVLPPKHRDGERFDVNWREKRGLDRLP